jgi:hypothetical protein
MTQGLRPIPLITLGRILQPRQTIYSAFSDQLAWSRNVIFKIGLIAGVSVWTDRAAETVPLNHAFMNPGSTRGLCSADMASTAPLSIEVGSPC